MNRQDTAAISLPNDLGYLPAALAFVRAIAEYTGFGPGDRRRIELAVEEAAANVIQHAFPPGETHSFDIVCRQVAGGLEICVHDKGVPWDPTLDPDYQPDVSLDQQTGRGLGEFLIKQLMDRYSYQNLGHDGKQVSLIKYLATPHIGDTRPPPDESHTRAGPPPHTGPSPPTVEYDIRRMRPKEAIAVSRAVFDSYGYSYAGDFVYYPERIAAMNASGQLLSAVAVVKETGEVAGHNALLFSDDLPAELAIAVTRHEFRGLGIARELGAFLEREAERMGLRGIYTKQVTVHPFTQKFVAKLGFRDCGLLLAHSPRTLSFKGIADQAAQRNSDVLGIRLFGQPQQRRLYLPEQHRDVIVDLYARLQIPLELLGAGQPPAADQRTLLKASINSARSLCEIHLDQYGSDLVGLLKQELRRVRREEINLVEMYLRMTDPATPWVSAEAEKLGFFFTGVLPETRGGDALVMQYFNGIQIDYGDLVIERPETAALLRYVSERDPNN
ncbi:hypothetical protein F2Q65_03200 [Thiohalocapsa marina]|uniref:N-acetyltransferase domain-containing protein n=1 Tax=Thiohalocapsa marina TaxID=424902 RepID=A0A5M8FRA4_9GAMM|nr:GNAT family N-acetyltransferase [Thiohalocapsa marina]KAA6186910.1 hypothetical protein F2Q65_03200 [Thiohalocapsa marina]